MINPSPLQENLEQYEIPIEMESKIEREGAASGEYHKQSLSEFLAWGEEGCSVLATAGIVELEYASIQKSSGVFDAPCRGTIEISGNEQLEFIDRLSTQKLLDLKVGESCLSFMLNEKGRIVADAIIRHLDDSIWIDVDATVVRALVDHLHRYVVMEDVSIKDISNNIHWFWILGPYDINFSIEKSSLHKLPSGVLGVEGVACSCSPDNVVQLWESVIQSGCRPIGWYALNMVRVEQLSPLFLVDFDTNNLPHETSLVQSRVRFDKGCYLGQEVVARMESLGKPKQQLIQLHIPLGELPIAGAQIWKDDSASGTPVGVVTSSAISPMRGGDAAIIAMLRKEYVEAGTSVFLYIGSELHECTVSSLHCDEDT